jgi:hypothetical protein
VVDDVVVTLVVVAVPVVVVVSSKQPHQPLNTVRNHQRTRRNS